MAEKPRLKKSDEILGSITAEPSRAFKTADSRPETGNGQEKNTKASEPENVEEEAELSEAQLPSAQDLAKKLLRREDKKPLDFSKYELPKRGTPAKTAVTAQAGETPAPPPKTAAPAAAAPQAVKTAAPRTAARSETPPSAAQSASQRPASVLFEQNPVATPNVMEYTFQSFEDEEEHPVREFQMENKTAAPEAPRRSLRERPRRRAQEARRTAALDEREDEREFEMESPFDPEPEEAAPPPVPKPQPKTKPKLAPEPAPEPPDDRLDPDERNRRDFLNRISSQFERQFEERFEDGLDPRDSISMRNAETAPPTGSAPPPRVAVASVPPPEPDDEPVRREQAPVAERKVEEDFVEVIRRRERERQEEHERRERESLSFEETSRNMPAEDSAASDFLSRFERDVRSEEEQRSEEFKDTLAQKFMRERERYLKELGELEPDEQPEEELKAAPPVRRKLDFQIQPEMHLPEDGDRPQPPKRDAGPVTYTRGAVARPQVSLHESLPEQPPRVGTAASRKTGEQLLMEFGRASRASAPAPAQRPEKFKFTFETPEEQVKKKKKEPLLPKEKWPRRIIITSMICGLISIALLIWPFMSYLRLSDRIAGAPEEGSAEAGPVVEDTLNVYDSIGFSQTAKANSVVFKKAGATLRNVDVENYVIIEGIESQGKIRLEDMNVKSAVSLKSSGIDTLELHNVRAGRVIVNNATTDVTVVATGSTDVGIIEIRTPASVRQTDMSAEAPGIRGMVIAAGDSGGSVNAKLDGLSLHTLDAEASETVLMFENETRAETMSSNGSLSLTGSGRVVSLSIGMKTGQGAGDLEDRPDVRLIVKGVSISNLNVKSPAILSLETSIDSIYTADNISVSGGGSVGAFTLNPGSGSGRLLADISGTVIQSLYSNAVSRINVTDSARVNTLTADQSTYALGNKVNHLVVNANDVIYENEPDRMDVANGIRPPQSKAENPNLDYNLTNIDIVSDMTGEDFATTCGHSRESGGFLLGDGSADDPYEVASPVQLAHADIHSGSHFIQTADISVAGDSRFASGFTMIGSSDSPFSGVYDGGGFAITNLRIVSSAECVGLFAANKGTIRNVKIVSGEIRSTSDSLSYVGGVTGLNVDGGAIRACSNGASVNGGQSSYAGGIAGYNFNSKVHDCYNYAKISGGDIAGGLVGLNSRSASLTGSYNAGLVEGSGEVGAVAGKNEDSTVANCYYLLDTAEYGIASGTGTAIDRTSSELMESQMAADLAAGNEDSLWIPGETSSGEYRYPMHKKPSS